ncbi:hypothetical protein LHYA1_G007991 [Lachnellula hyalina]|uniref:Uncharacterized protein n=1 Tax=Lachnellula hyalina TaxID=1316788 RepID=A0A8H8QV66_9HELO|nr:uncharacterized protein LHYA1_G007991 [Lachnellula hyalina]TVY23339.1 hypothetical protein LHYA1_G007991 [Lachnellula hyalina]
MAPRIIMFAGAPDLKSLERDEASLLTTFSPPFVRFFHLDGYESQVAASFAADATQASFEHPAWRSIPLERQHLPTGISQDHAWQEGASFFSTSEIDSLMEELSQKQTYESFESSSQSVKQVLSQFYEESYARHQDVPSSQIAAVSQTNTSSSGGTSFSTTDMTFDSPANVVKKDVPVAGSLNNIKDTPNAVYLSSIHPQTMTVNLIVGIISLPEPRLIKTRRGPDVELIEALVGDETKAGFAVNFWLSSSEAVDGGLRSPVQGLRPQDVVLMRNVALSSFRGKVYGQSLRKGMTKIHLLYRNRIDRTDVAGCYSAADLNSGELANLQVEKTKRVREWVMRFVGTGVMQKKGKRNALHESLPPDTQ